MICLEITVRQRQRIVEIWLTNAEKNDEKLRDALKGIYDEYHKKKYLVAVYESGKHDLYQNTLALLAYNKKRIEEIGIQREKQHKSRRMVKQ